MSTRQYSIRLPDDLLELAQSIAYDEHTTVTELLIAGLRMELDRRAKKGIFISIPPDAIISITAVGASGTSGGGSDGSGAVHIDIEGTRGDVGTRAGAGGNGGEIRFITSLTTP